MRLVRDAEASAGAPLNSLLCLHACAHFSVMGTGTLRPEHALPLVRHVLSAFGPGKDPSTPTPHPAAPRRPSTRAPETPDIGPGATGPLPSREPQGHGGAPPAMGPSETAMLTWSVGRLRVPLRGSDMRRLCACVRDGAPSMSSQESANSLAGLRGILLGAEARSGEVGSERSIASGAGGDWPGEHTPAEMMHAAAACVTRLASLCRTAPRETRPQHLAMALQAVDRLLSRAGPPTRAPEAAMRKNCISLRDRVVRCLLSDARGEQMGEQSMTLSLKGIVTAGAADEGMMRAVLAWMRGVGADGSGDARGAPSPMGVTLTAR